MTAGHTLAAADPAAVLLRHRARVARPWQRRLLEVGGPAAFLFAALLAIWWLRIAFGHIGPGLVELVKFVGLMLPPIVGPE